MHHFSFFYLVSFAGDDIITNVDANELDLLDQCAPFRAHKCP